MKPIDLAKAAGAGGALFVANMLLAVVVVTIYALLIEPGHPPEFYEEAALWIAPWSCHTIGTALFVAAGYWFAKRREDRDGFAFALAIVVMYAIIDSATMAFASLFDIEFGLSMLAKLAAALAGAFLASRATRTAATTLE